MSAGRAAPKLAVRVVARTEIRMGSPWDTCRLSFRGAWTPTLPTGDWTGHVVHQPGGSAVALGRWDARGNTPGFQIVIVDPVRRTVQRGRRVEGACEGLAWEGRDRVAWASSSGRRGAVTFRRRPPA